MAQTVCEQITDRINFLKKFGLLTTKSTMVKKGDIYGRLTVVEVGQLKLKHRYMAVCQCRCGSALRVVRQESLVSGMTISCGCFQKEQTTKHGLSKVLHYSRWHGMMARCYKPNDARYAIYGGRGIKVHEAWHDVTTFISELPEGYAKGLQLDRIDNDGNYEPGNVRWVTPKKNSNNRGFVRLLTYKGRNQTMTEWAEEYGLAMSLVWDRLEIWKWDLERALTTPPADRKENMLKAQSLRWKGHTKKPSPKPKVLKTYEYWGKIYTMAQLSELCGTSVNLLRKRIDERGWSVERAVETKLC